VTKKLDRGYAFHEHTADITLECWAPTLDEAFEQAALGTFAVIVDLSTIEPLVPVDIDVKGIDLPELLVEWIGRLIALIDINSQFFSEFEVLELKKTEDGYILKGRVWGEEINLERHDTNTEVKAMTYADLKIDSQPDKTVLWFTLDL
jgi:SHS2 domain-containing protein